MRCGSVRKKMFLYFENKVKQKEKEKITEHLKTCAWCMAEYQKGEHILNVMRGGYPKELPDTLHKNIMQELYGLKSYDEEHKKEVKFMFGTFAKRAGLVLASVLTVCVLIVSIPFDTVKEKGLDGIDYLSNVISDMGNAKNDSVEKNAEAPLMTFGVDTGTREKTASNKKENEVLEEDKMLTMTMPDMNDASNARGVEIEESLNDAVSMNMVTSSAEDTLVDNESYMSVRTSKFDEALSSIKEISNKHDANIYSRTITYLDEEYRNAEVKVKVKLSNLEKFKSEIGKAYKVELDTEETIDNTGLLDQDKEMLETLKKDKIDLETKLSSATTEEDKNNYKIQITNIDVAIGELEAKLNSEGLKMARVNITLDEISELEETGIIDVKTFFRNAGSKFSKGTENFVRLMQDCALWVCENILAIAFYFIVFIIVYSLLKYAIENFKE